MLSLLNAVLYKRNIGSEARNHVHPHGVGAALILAKGPFGPRAMAIFAGSYGSSDLKVLRSCISTGWDSFLQRM